MAESRRGSKQVLGSVGLSGQTQVEAPLLRRDSRRAFTGPDRALDAERTALASLPGTELRRCCFGQTRGARVEGDRDWLEHQPATSNASADATRANRPGQGRGLRSRPIAQDRAPLQPRRPAAQRKIEAGITFKHDILGHAGTK